MAIQFQLRRGTTVQNNAFVGAEGEITVDTEKHAIRIHDGVTPGGYTQDFVTETWISDDGLSWYRKYSSGWVEQGSYYTLTSTSYEVINLITPMLTDTYSLNAVYKDINGTDGSIHGLNTGKYTTTSFSAKVGTSGANVGILWQVSGLGAQ